MLRFRVEVFTEDSFERSLSEEDLTRISGLFSPGKTQLLSWEFVREVLKGGTLLLAMDTAQEDAIVGVATLLDIRHLTARFAELHDVAVAETHRQYGVEQLLIEEALTVATMIGAQYVQWAVHQHSSRGRQVCQALDLESVERFVFYRRPL